MGKYKVNIVLTDEREINAVVSAENQAEALKRLINAEKFQEFINESGSGEAVDVKHVNIEPVEDVPINPDRYDLRPSEEKDGWWVATDKENLFLVRFEAHRYNETAQILPIEEFPLDAQKVPRCFARLPNADDVPQNPVNVMSMEHFDISTASREELAAYLQQLRTSCGWSIRKIAEQSGLSPATVVNMEAGKFTARMDVINKYIKVLGAKMIIIPE